MVEMTVVFADLCHFTGLTAKLGPQRTHEVVDAFLKMASQALVGQDAVIDKYLGDAVMAFFNVPIKHEDHPLRAVRAAVAIQYGMLSLRQRFGMELETSIGIATGWAHVGRLGSQDRKDYTAVGDVVNLAARLREHARPGEILVDPTVYTWAETDFPGVSAETLVLKGFDEALQAHRLNAREAAPMMQAVTGGSVRRRLSLGAVIFAFVGAPCVLYATLGPWAIPLGISVLFGASSALWWLDADQVRFPLLVLAVAGSAANLYAVWYARRLRVKTASERQFVILTGPERRRTRWVIGLSLLTIGVVLFELVAHHVYHGSIFGT